MAAAVRRATAVDDVEVALGESKGHQGDDDEETTGKGKGYDAFFSWLMWKLKPKLKILVVSFVSVERMNLRRELIKDFTPLKLLHPRPTLNWSRA